MEDNNTEKDEECWYRICWESATGLAEDRVSWVILLRPYLPPCHSRIELSWVELWSLKIMMFQWFLKRSFTALVRILQVARPVSKIFEVPWRSLRILAEIINLRFIARFLPANPPHTTSTWTRSILSSYFWPSCRSLSWMYSGLKWWYLKLKEILLLSLGYITSARKKK